MSSLSRHAIDLIRSAVSPPSYLVLYVTNHCDLGCPFCFNREARSAGVPEMTADQHRRLARSTGRLFELLITGGEPFLRDDLPDILLEYLRSHSTTVITIPTSGGHPEAIGQLLNRIAPVLGSTRLHVNLSVDGTPAAHDALRGRRGLSDDIVRSASILHRFKQQHPNLWLGVITVYGSHNADHFDEVAQWVRNEIRPDIHDVGMERAVVMNAPPAEVLDTYRRIESLLERTGALPTGIQGTVYEAFRSHFIDSVRLGKPAWTCTAGRSLLTISVDGKVYPCEPLWLDTRSYPAFQDPCMGDLNAHDFRLDQLLRSDHARAVRTLIAQEACRCFWECALFASVLFTHRGWIRIARGLFR